MNDKIDTSKFIRQHFSLQGIVQGVGFRPFVYGIARELHLTGFVYNTPSGVEIEIQGKPTAIEGFAQRLVSSTPPLAIVSSCQFEEIDLLLENEFTIKPSSGGMADIQIAPDSALCQDCLKELLDPTNHRYRYPFITCTNCGPRYSIITNIPYDRQNTTMDGFPLCPICRSEYENPDNRRFHAQPLCCPKCGPQLVFMDSNRVKLSNKDDALKQTEEMLLAGMIVAIKGIGGFHLAVDATNNEAVQRLRERKKRDEKPFAIMLPNILTAAEFVVFDDLEKRLLSSSEAPIVILRSKENPKLSSLIAPANQWLGVMLPYTPLHHLLFPKQIPLVMTSANNSNEPILFKDSDAVEQLSGIADYILTHNRPIQTRSDDSIIRVFQGKPLFYRRSRGYAPRGITLPFVPPPVLALGAELKSAICLTQGNRAVLSQHIGDLQNDATLSAFEDTINSLSTLLQVKPALVACDLHPDYLSSVYASQSKLPQVQVQHHHAHLAACMAENQLEGDVIGLIFDGTGYGVDETLWGGEILVGGYNDFQRAGHFRPARLPGGDLAVKQPWRMAYSYLFQSDGADIFKRNRPINSKIQENERSLFIAMLERGLNSPWSSSCGRLFDAVAAILDLYQTVSYDGQAAIALEALAESATLEQNTKSYPYKLAVAENTPFQLDFHTIFPAILDDLHIGINRCQIAGRFHKTIAEAALESCLYCSEKYKLNEVVLSGGVFQNKLLTDMLYTNLTNHGLKVFTHRLTPPNDGCIPLGQAAVAGWKNRLK